MQKLIQLICGIIGGHRGPIISLDRSERICLCCGKVFRARAALSRNGGKV